MLGNVADVAQKEAVAALQKALQSGMQKERERRGSRSSILFRKR